MIKRLRTFLDDNQIHYDTVKCTTTDPVETLVSVTNVPEKGIAKTVIVKTDGKFIMLVEPISVETDLPRWQELMGCKEIKFATEEEVEDLFGELELDSLPAFGNLFNMDVVVDDSLSVGDMIACGTGTSTELIKLAYEDYVKWVKPKLFHIH